MNRRTNIFGLNDNLINCIKECLSNVSSTSQLALNLDNNMIKDNMNKEQIELNKPSIIIKKNNFEIIVKSIIPLLGDDKFRIEKNNLPENCQFCKNKRLSGFDINYININLDNYLGKEFLLDDFFNPVIEEEKCYKCKKDNKVEYYFTLLPEILIIILGAKSEDKKLIYKYKTTLKYYNKNKNPVDCEYILKGLVGQIDELKFKSFIFNSENIFNNLFENNEEIFSNPTILLYEGPKKNYNEDNEYLEHNHLGPAVNDVNNNMITIYFNFPKFDKKIYIDSESNEKFFKVISELKDKYDWLKNLKNLKFYLGNRLLEENKTLAENGIKDNSEIDIM